MRISATDLPKLRELGPRGLGQLAAAGCLLPVLRASIAVFGPRRTAAYVRRTVEVTERVPGRSASTAPAVLYERIELAGRRGLIPATCLPQSMLLWAWLRRSSRDPSLRIGVGEGGVLLEAHAWVEADGEHYGHRGEQAFEGFDLMQWPR